MSELGNRALNDEAREHGHAAAAPTCEHYWAWVSPTGTNRSARICQLCHEPDPTWLDHVVEVDRGHSAGCVHCEFAEVSR